MSLCKLKTIHDRIYAPSSDDEIVISGISGKFPNSKNINEFSYNLYNKVDMVDERETRWPNYNAEIPARMGKVDDIEKFDATFFGVPYKQTNTMDPQCRLLIETAYEAIMDAGVNPKTIRGSKTGVYIGACFVETEKTFFYDQVTASGLGITGCSRAMLANRVSYCLGLNGPSFLIDTACSSSMYALDVAFTAIRNGECEAALVGGSNLLLHPYTSLQFSRLGVLALDGFCRPFDHKASGYTRSEAVCVVYLQKAKVANRIYANVIYSKTNCDGYKEEGITYPSGTMQQELLSDFYDDLKLDPRTLDYVEAHSTGTVVGDPEECKALDNIFCQNRKNPLLVGSVKSNIGHTESCSGACSIVKVIFAFENSLIPPNLHFEKVKKSIPSLAQKRMIVCDEPTPFNGNKIAINSFGFGGANAHALLSRHEKSKINYGLPGDNLPRLVNWAGRTEEAVNNVLNELELHPLDAEYIALLHNIQREETPGYIYRGFNVLVKDSTNANTKAKSLSRLTNHIDENKVPVVWLFSGMGSQWTSMASTLMDFSVFKESIQACHDTLIPYGIDLISVITSNDEKILKNIVNSFVGIAAVQIGLVNMLHVLDVPMDYCIGHSVGELGCAYADGTMTAEQMILSAYARGLVSKETEIILGSMAAVGLSYNKVKDILPSSIEVACHNSFESSTISGPKDDVATFVASLKSRGVFAKEVQCSNIPYHSKYISEMGPKLLKRLHEIIPSPKRRSRKWLSTSAPKSEWNIKRTQFSSAEYHTNNLLHSVLFEETIKYLPSKTICIEIAPHGLLQAIVKKSMPESIHIPLTHRGHTNNAAFFLSALGNLFLHNYTLPIERLYPKITFPVSRGTANISSLIKWDHHEDWFVMKHETHKICKSGERKVTVSLEENPYTKGHVIDGRCIFPATGYLELVWETLSMVMTGSIYSAISVEFEDVRFLRATSMAPGQHVELNIMIHYGNGEFEITENSVTVVSGRIRVIENNSNQEYEAKVDDLSLSDIPSLNKNDLYKELRLRGYNYQGLFRGIEEARCDGRIAKIKWNDNWPAFMDCLLQLNILTKDSRSLYLPTRIRRIRIDSMKHTEMVGRFDGEDAVFDATYDPDLKLLKCGGIEIYEMVASSVVRRKAPGLEVLSAYNFIPLVANEKIALKDTLNIILQLILESIPTTNTVEFVEIDDGISEPLLSEFSNCIAETPVLKGDLKFLTDREINSDRFVVKNEKLIKSKTRNLVIGTNLLSETARSADILSTIDNNGFILSRQSNKMTFDNVPVNFRIISAINSDNEIFILLRRIQVDSFFDYKAMSVFEIFSNDFKFEWIESVRLAIKEGPVLLLAQNDQYSGLIGFVNCLRREPNGHNVKCMIIADRSAPAFSFEHSLYRSQLQLGLSVNIYRNTVWGTYRFFELNQVLEESPRIDHCIANVQRLGDLSSFDWCTGKYAKASLNSLVNIHYSSINFRDVMLATGRLAPEICGESRLSQECLLGLEYSGVNSCGDRVMGMIAVGSLATQAEPVENLTWIVPKYMSLQEAATIPAVYITVYYSFFFYRPIVRGNSILIHAGSGGIGLSAIRVALAYGLQVFTTVSTEQKKKFILSLFPQLKAENIGNSRDCSFEKMVMHETEGRGVDFVLNSLSDEKLLASVRCLARNGTFLEIGKFDIMNNSPIGMNVFAKETTFRAVFADNLIHLSEECKIIHQLIDRDLRTGIIQPLHSTVFSVNEIENAYRFLSTGKHVGKVMIQVRDDERSVATVPIKVTPRIYCNEELVYVLVGGLGGFGIELADWLVIRGARKIVLNSRRGITSSYQSYRTNLWESYGCKVLVNTADVTTYQGCKNLLVESLTQGQIGGIFNLAAVLRDGIFENQSIEKFKESLAPKANATRYLNDLSRVLCPKLEHFVVFSSTSCGRGNAGQSNYGMANSIMERIIEQRALEKLPAKAIQWGAIGDVGLVAEMVKDKLDAEVAGTLQQRISSCLNVLDKLLTTPNPIVSSIVIADKNASDNSGDPQRSLMKSVMKIMGIRDVKTISTNASLAELGMDSLMSVEIKQMLEREFDIFLSAQELRSITFGKFQEMSSGKASNRNKSTSGLDLVFRNLGDESTCQESAININSIEGKSSAIIVPGIEGVAGKIWHSFGGNLTIPVKLVQLWDSMNAITIKDISDISLNIVQDVQNNQNEFYIIGYSFGSLVALHLAHLLESIGKTGRILLVDGAPIYLQRLAAGIVQTMKGADSDDALIFILYHNLCNAEHNEKFSVQIQGCDTWEQKIDTLYAYLSDEIRASFSPEYLHRMYTAMSNRLKAVNTLNVVTDMPQLKSQIKLVRPQQASFFDIADDYELTKYVSQPVEVQYIEGDHLTMLENPKLADIVNEFAPFSAS